MTWQWSPEGLLALSAAVGFLGLAGVVWGRRADERWNDGAAWLVLVMLANGAWAAAYTLEVASSSRSAFQAWGDLQYVGICMLPPTWVAFVAAYTGRDWLRRRVLLLLAVEPATVLLLLSNESTHDLIRTYPSGSSRVAGAGPLFWPHSVYTYLVLWAATAVLVTRLSRVSPIHRRRSTVLVASLAVPFLCNLLYNAGVPPFDSVDLTPFAFLGSGAVLVWGVTSFRFARARPVARSQVFTAIDDLVVTLDPEHRVIDLNPAAAAAFGLPAEDLIGQPVDALLPHAEQAIGEHEPDRPVEESIAGRVYELQASPLTDRRSRLLGSLLLGHDVTERKDVEQRLSHQALHDPLTGVANRTLYFDRLTHALDHAARTRRPVSVLFVDLDSFKQVNDELGHAAGNDVLVTVARRLRSSVRKGDTIARMGGDEFAVLLEDVDADSDPAQVAAHIRSSLARPMEVSGRQLTVTASVGVATGCDLQPDEIVRRADESMYDEKHRRCRD
jgi:diguanylate cyclase (GGDEF)-like protein/PAS domain S-box-containing protein